MLEEDVSPDIHSNGCFASTRRDASKKDAIVQARLLTISRQGAI